MTWTLDGSSVGDLSYGYDADWRVTSKNGTLATITLPSAVNANTFNADNEMTAFNGAALTYDANGNLTNDGTNMYSWDARDHLSAVSGGSTASFVYDGLGRRMSKTIAGTGTQFLYDGLNPVQELQAGTPSANMLTGLGIDQYFQRSDASGTSSYLTDALGSTLALANPAGGIATSYTYDPFGNSTGSGTNPFQFTGRENDGTGLYFYRARYYSPTLQRFVSQDPIGFAGGDSNLYGYVLNSPVNGADPFGLRWWDWLPLWDCGKGIYWDIKIAQARPACQQEVDKCGQGWDVDTLECKADFCSKYGTGLDIGWAVYKCACQNAGGQACINWMESQPSCAWTF